MINELHLEGGDLIAFALVFSFTKGDAGKYIGNTAYLSAWTGWTEKTSRGHLASLVSRGLIVEERGLKGNRQFCHYKLAPDFYEKCPVKITGEGGKNYRPRGVKITAEGGKNYRQEKNIEENIKNRIPPSPQEVEEYARSRGFEDPEGFTKHFMDYYGQAQWHLANGRPMKDWKKAVITWEPNNKHRSFETTKAIPASTKRVPFDINTLR